MVTFVWLTFALIALILFNYGPVDKIAPVDRIGFSLVIIGVGIIPLSMWMVFLPTFALIILGVILIVFVPTGDYYRQRNERRALESARREKDDAHADT